MNPRQLAFCEEYLVDLNAAAAAVRAGYAPARAKQTGSDLLQRPEVQARITALREARSERTASDGDRVVLELARRAFYDPGVIAGANVAGPGDIAKLPEDVRRCIDGWSWDKQGRFVLKLAAKTPALELLGRHHGLFRDKVEVTGQDGGPLEVTDVRQKVADRLARLAAAKDASS